MQELLETPVTLGSVHIAGEITSNISCNIEKIARETLRKI